jgi:uncharacterized protein YndB with AHSA1/START domain
MKKNVLKPGLWLSSWLKWEQSIKKEKGASPAMLIILAALTSLTISSDFTPLRAIVLHPNDPMNNNHSQITLNSKKMNSDTMNMVLTRVFDAPLEKLWNAWGNKETVMQWWGPTGFTCPVANMEFREGGTSLVCMRAPKEWGGKDMYNTWNYKKIEPMKLIEFIQGWCDKDGKTIDPLTMGLPPDIPKEVRHIITFRALDAGKTEMTVTEFGYTVPQTVELSRAGMGQCLDKMAVAIK